MLPHAVSAVGNVGLPAQQVVNAVGEVGYMTILEFTDRIRSNRLREMAVAALRELGVEE
jgi:hypothetical protein